MKNKFYFLLFNTGLLFLSQNIFGQEYEEKSRTEKMAAAQKVNNAGLALKNAKGYSNKNHEAF